MLLWLFVATRIVANPVSNVFQKRLAQRSAHPLAVIAATHAVLTLACAPWLIGPLELAGGPSFWSNIGVAGVLAVSGNAVLVAALAAGDLSVIGPINAYKAVLGVGLGVVLLREMPTPLGALGVLLILIGSAVVMERDQAAQGGNALLQFFRNPGVQLRFVALALSATEAVFLKRALLASSPATTFVAWCVVGLAIGAAATALLLRGRWRHEVAILRGEWRTCMWLGLTTGLMQLTTLLTFGQLQVGYSLALFQLSTPLSVFLGYRYFQEKHLGRRLAGALVMVGGAVLIGLFGA